MNGLSDGRCRRAESVTIDVQRVVAGANVVRVIGDLRADTAWALHRTVAEKLMRSPALLALDLSEVERIDGAGVDALVSAAALAGESGISFCLVGVQAGPVGTALAAADMTELSEIFPSVNEAWEDSR
jgi:anti-sigma B factor antagonist